MAVIAVLAGGFLGFVCAALGLVMLDLGWVSALALWWASGSLGAILFLIARLGASGQKPAIPGSLNA